MPLPQILFTLFSMFSGASIGAALFAASCYARVHQMTNDPRRKKLLRHTIAVNVGTAGTYAVLLWAIIPTAVVQPTGLSWAYMVFLLVAAMGFVGLASSASDELAGAEIKTEAE